MRCERWPTRAERERIREIVALEEHSGHARQKLQFPPSTPPASRNSAPRLRPPIVQTAMTRS